MVNSLQVKHEVIRKALHLSSLWIPIMYYFAEYTTMFNLLLLLSAVALFIDIFRHKHNKIGMQIRVGLKFFNLDSLFREHEYKGALCGATYMLLTGLLCLMVFPKSIFIMAFSVMVVSDTIAGIAGRFWGKHKIMSGKSWEGFTAFFVSACVISIPLCILFNYNIIIGILASLAAGITELISQKFLKLDDNFTVPIIYGLAFITFNASLAIL